MNIESMVIPATNDFASLYIDQKEPVRGFFHYDITENAVFEKRYHDLMARGFDRQKLVTCIADYMKPFPKSGKTEESLKKLQDKDFHSCNRWAAGRPINRAAIYNT